MSYLTSELLESLEIKSGSVILESEECGKVINGFECYVACVMDTEKASVAKVNDKVTLRLPSLNEVEATIKNIIEESDEKRIIVFEIIDKVEELLQYRKVNVDVIWWNYRGLKVSNQAISEEKDINYVERSKAGYTEKIYVKILRQNDTYSIIENYTDDELLSLGLSEDEVQNRKELSLYDEILLH